MAEKTNTTEEAREAAMHEAFWVRARKIIDNEYAYANPARTMRAGLEIEYSLMGPKGRVVTEEERNCVASTADFLDLELGADQIELRSEPVDLMEKSFHDLLAHVEKRQRLLVNAARSHGLSVLSSGCHALANPKNIRRTNKEKYRLVPDFHNSRRVHENVYLGPNNVFVGDAAIVGVLNAAQINLEALGVTDAIDKLNRSFMIAPIATALSSNASVIDCFDTGFEDVRMVAWELSHDTRDGLISSNGRPTRVGLPADYFASIEDYFSDVASYPFILGDTEHAFDIGIGIYWRDARIKFIGDSCVVEFRPISTQCTSSESVAVLAFYTGRLLWSQAVKERLMPMELVRQNKLVAMQQGRSGKFWAETSRGYEKVPGPVLIAQEISRSCEGFEMAGIVSSKYAKDLVLSLKKRAETTPSEELTNLLQGNEGNPAAVLLALDKQGALLK